MRLSFFMFFKQFSDNSEIKLPYHCLIPRKEENSSARK